MGHSNLLSFNMPPISKGGLLGVLSGAGGGGAGAEFFQLIKTITATGTTDTLDSGTIDAFDNLMFIGYKLSSGTADMVFQVNSDNSNNYAYRKQDNGGSDGTNTPTNRLLGDNGGYSTPSFQIGFINNIQDENKLMIGKAIGQNTAGAGNVPIRRESVSIWNENDRITSVQAINLESGSLASGSELVVMGYNNDVTSGGSTWEQLAHVELDANADSMDSGTFDVKKYLMFQIQYTGTGGNVVNSIRFNGTTGSEYARRGSDNGGSDQTDGSETQITNGLNSDISSGDSAIMTGYIVNIQDEEKLVIAELTSNDSGTGTGTGTDMADFVGKWANTSDNITSIQVPDLSGGKYTTGSTITVWGFDP